MEKLVNLDFYLNSSYLPANADKGEWKRFFKLLGVKEGFQVIAYPNRTTVTKLITYGYLQEFFDLDDKRFRPFYSSFVALEYADLNNIFLLPLSLENFDVAKVFWTDVIKFVAPNDLLKPAIAFWGRAGYPGWQTGDKVSNYIQWYIKNHACIPTSTGLCQTSSDTFLNDEQIEAIGGKYLPIFDGPQLNADWRSLFQFKSQLELKDYLIALTNISQDVRGENKKRVQLIYEHFLNSCLNWSTAEQELIKDWSLTGRLLDQNGVFRPCVELKHYLDGDNSVFQNAYHFIYLNRSNQQHSSLTNIARHWQSHGAVIGK